LSKQQGEGKPSVGEFLASEVTALISKPVVQETELHSIAELSGNDKAKALKARRAMRRYEKLGNTEKAKEKRSELYGIIRERRLTPDVKPPGAEKSPKKRFKPKTGRPRKPLTREQKDRKNANARTARAFKKRHRK
jgi:hypothetical protein